MVVRRHPAYGSENGSNLFCILRYWLQIWSVGSCGHNEHWGIIFEGTSKTVTPSLWHFEGGGEGVGDNSKLIIIVYCNPQLPLILSYLKPARKHSHSTRIFNRSSLQITTGLESSTHLVSSHCLKKIGEGIGA